MARRVTSKAAESGEPRPEYYCQPPPEQTVDSFKGSFSEWGLTDADQQRQVSTAPLTQTDSDDASCNSAGRPSVNSRSAVTHSEAQVQDAFLMRSLSQDGGPGMHMRNSIVPLAMPPRCPTPPCMALLVLQVLGPAYLGHEADAISQDSSSSNWTPPDSLDAEHGSWNEGLVHPAALALPAGEQQHTLDWGTVQRQ